MHQHQPKEVSDEALCQAAADDARAYEALFYRYLEFVTWYMRRENVRDPDSVGVHTLALAIHGARRSDPPVRNFRAYLIRVLKREVARAKGAAYEPAADTESLEFLSPKVPDHAYAVILAADVTAALTCIEEPTREMLILQACFGLSIKELSSLYGEGESCIKTRLSRARQQLRSVPGLRDYL